MTEENVKTRLLAFISYLGMGQTRFEEYCGLSRGFVNKLTDGVGINKVMEIYRKFPDLSLSWLITGEGEMCSSNDEMDAPKDNLTVYLEKRVKELEEENKRLIVENTEFRTKYGVEQLSNKAI